MFDGVAKRYDIMNDVLTLGITRAWRHATTEAIGPRPGMVIADLAAGTATSSVPLARAGARVLACDFSLGMLREGQRRAPDMPLMAADVTKLPFKDDEFDAVTISFALRNIVDPHLALREMARVTKPGGKLVVTEFSHPVWKPWRTFYMQYLMRALPAMASSMSSNPDAYDYLAESIVAWPSQRELARQIQQAGWHGVEYKNLTGGIVAIHRATAPGQK